MYMGNEKFYDNILMPAFHQLDPEVAHNLAVQAAKYNIIPEAKLKESKVLVSTDTLHKSSEFFLVVYSLNLIPLVLFLFISIMEISNCYIYFQ